jgi:hypothetical protein
MTVDSMPFVFAILRTTRTPFGRPQYRRESPR